MRLSPSPVSPRCGKVRHPSYRIAHENLRHVLAGQDAAAKDRISLRVFRCDYCGGWHLGNARDDFVHKRRVAYKRSRAALAEALDGELL